LRLVAASAADDPRLPDGTLDWSRLMAQAQDGDRRAYRLLLEDMTPYLRTLALRCFKEPSDIEDVVQDVLLTVHAVRHTYDRARPYGPWLAAIARRRIIDRLRSQARAKLREVALTVEPATLWLEPASPQQLEQDTRARELRAAIDNLPPDQREAINLLKLKELSLKEASSMTGRSVAALKVATHRAMKRLRELMQREAGGLQ
jgi:RNA polymerase sigma-70 factor (ECF subfamily)